MIQGFPALSSPDARCLILGSIPGLASLQAQEYYAHTRNQFWPIMLHLFEGQSGWNYQQRCQMLKQRGIALWDVVYACKRQGSLDSAIETDSLIINDFTAFFAQHPLINTVYFNGGTSANYFKRWVQPGLNQPLTYKQLPSTSPAYAALSLPDKLLKWQQILESVAITSVYGSNASQSEPSL